MRSLRTLPVALVALLCLAFAAANAAAKASHTSTTTATGTTATTSASPAYFGFNDSAVAWGQASATTDAALAAQVGANTSRVTFDWRWAEATQATWDFSTCPVLGGALANDDDANTSSAMNYFSFLQGMYAAGAKGDMDGLSLHAYPGDIDLWRFFKMLTTYRDIRDSNGDSVPLWVTEAGASTVGSQDTSYPFNQN